MIIQQNLTVAEKLKILTDAAKYDVACTSSGAGRRGKAGALGNAEPAGICHSFSADGRCISLLKILFTNQCIYDCKYCVNRSSNDTVRTAFTPEEICRLTMEFYRRNYIEGLFLSSGIFTSPDHTMEQIYQAVYLLRVTCRFNGYIHVKAIPGASAELIERVGFLADRMSINLELPTADGLKRLAPGKTRDKILKPMRQIQQGILHQKLSSGCGETQGLLYGKPKEGFAGGEALFKPFGQKEISAGAGDGPLEVKKLPEYKFLSPESARIRRGFVPAGQSTQIIVGATPENDYQMIKVTGRFTAATG